MNISDLGEIGFINNLTSAFSREPFSSLSSVLNCCGIGDDCAVVDMGHARSMLVTTDMLVEGVHFLRQAISARELGAKSLAVNLSDVAAMGARPFASFMSISLPRELDKSWADDFIEGYRDLSARHNVLLLGGDTVGGDKIVINIVAMGQLEKASIKYRSGSKVGDKIMVTGSLGESAAGLKIILSELENRNQWTAREKELVDIHHNPVAQVEQGAWLGQRGEVSAMMDVSDGLLNDIKHLTKTHGAQIDALAIPTSVDIATAIGGGEDYELLLTVDPRFCEKLKEDYLSTFNQPLYEIGCITENKNIEWLNLDAEDKEALRTFSHF